MRADRAGRGLVRGEAGVLFWKYLQGQVLRATHTGPLQSHPLPIDNAFDAANRIIYYSL